MLWLIAQVFAAKRTCKQGSRAYRRVSALQFYGDDMAKGAS